MVDRTNIRQQSGSCYWHFKPTKGTGSLIGANKLLKRPLKTSSLRQAKKRRDIMQGLIYLLDDLEFNPLETLPQMQFIWSDIINHLSSLSPVELEELKPEKDIEQYTSINKLLEQWLVVQNRSIRQADTKGARNLNESIATMKNAVTAFLAANGGYTDYPIRKITKGTAAKLRDHVLYDQKKSINRFRAFCTHLTKLWDDAAERDLVVGESPFKGLKVEGAKTNNDRRPFTAIEAKQVSSLFEPKSEYYEDWLATNFYLTSGCRRGELFNVKKDDLITSDKGTFILIGESGKTDAAQRVIPIHPALAPHFTALIKTLQGTDLIFSEARKRIITHPDKKLADPFGKRFSKRLKANLNTNDGLCLHCARHFVLTALDHADVQTETSAQLVGHATTGNQTNAEKMKRIYSTGKTAEQLNKAMQLAWDTELMKPLINMIKQNQK